MYSVHCPVAEGSVTSWLYEAIGDVESLLDLANDEARHDEARESLLSIQQAAVGRWQDVDKLLCLAAEFAETRQVCCSQIGYSYSCTPSQCIYVRRYYT